MSAATLDRLDARVDRCGSCGAWEFDGVCRLCSDPGGCTEPPPFRKISCAAGLENPSTPLAGPEDLRSEA